MSSPDRGDGREPVKLTEIASGVAVSGRTRRVLYEGDPREDDYLEMQREAESIRRALADVRRRLEVLGRRETHFWFDSVCVKVAGALTLGVGALYGLVVGERSFAARAQRSRELWEKVEQDPDAFLIKPGKFDAQ